MTQKILALIPARGGSKSVPGKNIMPLVGRPLIAYSILHAMKSRLINRVVVSTDDSTISQVAKEWGAEVPFMRPEQYAQDSSPDIDVFRHALSWLKENEGYEPDMVVHLRPPGPVRRVELIDEAIDLLAKHPDADAVRSVGPAVQTPYKMWSINTDGYLAPLLKLEGTVDCQSLPRQQQPKVFWQNGYVDVG
jgi:CMP-N,N'-diacetyllegionaminic acid synthase